MPPMRISLTVTTPGSAPSAGDLARYAERAERLGYHALYVADHHIYSGPTMHAPTALAVLAQATEEMPVGFSIYQLPLRHPVAAAKELAMLDALSDGRLIAGVGAGSYEPEFDAFGIPFAGRGRRMDEVLEAIKVIWASESASFEGEFFRFENIHVAPKPVQDPHPPIWIGSWTGAPRAARRVVRHAAGWQASGMHTTVEEVREGWRVIERVCAEEGRDPSTIGRAYVNAITHLAANSEVAWSEVNDGLREREELRIIGTPDDAITKLRALQDAGVEEVSLLLADGSLDQLDLIAREVMPAFA
jgi:probable F420-dependent oxidoreductase